MATRIPEERFLLIVPLAYRYPGTFNFKPDPSQATD